MQGNPLGGPPNNLGKRDEKEVSPPLHLLAGSGRGLQGGSSALQAYRLATSAHRDDQRGSITKLIRN